MPLTFQQFIASLNLQHFSAAELLVSTSKPGNAEPPERIWPNIVPTIIILDKLRETLGKPITISSCYRNRVYNQRIGGVKLSQHTAFTAIDFKVRNVSPQRVKNQLIDWRDNGEEFLLPFPIERKRVTVQGETIGQTSLHQYDVDHQRFFQFDGGIGVYRTFVHLDTRGSNHIWYGQGVGDVSA